MNRFILIIIFYIILACCIGISSILSYRGFLPSLKELTIPFVLVIALGLFAASSFLQLSRDSKSISKQILALCLFLFFALFSTSSNFTSIYTTRMAGEIKRAAFDEEYSKFKKTLVTIENELSRIREKENVSIVKLASFAHGDVDAEISRLKRAISQSKPYVDIAAKAETITDELREMRNQALDPNRIGCGRKCREHMSTIDDLVKSADTAMPKGTTKIEITRNIDIYERKIWVSFCSTEAFMPYHLIRSMVERVPNDYRCKALNRDFEDTYGSDRLEGFRGDIKLKESYTIEALADYVIAVSNTAKNVELMLKELEIYPFFETLTADGLGSLPRTIETLSERFSNSNSDIIELEVSDATNRQKLSQAISSLDYKTIDAIKSDGSIVSYPLTDSLYGNQVVIEGEHIKIILEPLLSMQNELISWYREFTDLDVTSDFTLVDPTNGEIGQIDETLRSGLIDVPDLAQTLMALIMGFTIDLIPILFAFVVFHGYRPEEKGYDPMGAEGT